MYRGDADCKYCLGFGIFLDYLKEWPDYSRGVDLVSQEEAIELVEKWDRQGYVHSIWTIGTPFIAYMCQCEYPTCVGLRHRQQYDMDFAFLKSEHVAKIDIDRCTGCRRCISRCQFGAITWSPDFHHPVIDMRKCFGCGICREPCETDAITLVPRESLPLLRNVW